jgi:hypothetical protein
MSITRVLDYHLKEVEIAVGRIYGRESENEIIEGLRDFYIHLQMVKSVIALMEDKKNGPN